MSGCTFGSHSLGTEHWEGDLNVGLLFDRSPLPEAGRAVPARSRFGPPRTMPYDYGGVDVVALRDPAPQAARSASGPAPGAAGTLETAAQPRSPRPPRFDRGRLDKSPRIVLP